MRHLTMGGIDQSTYLLIYEHVKLALVILFMALGENDFSDFV